MAKRPVSRRSGRPSSGDAAAATTAVCDDSAVCDDCALADTYSRLEAFDRRYCSSGEEGFRQIAGVDEAGRGALAGPVVSAAVILPRDSRLLGVDDSKKVTEKFREELFQAITSTATAVCIAVGQPSIDRQTKYPPGHPDDDAPGGQPPPSQAGPGSGGRTGHVSMGRACDSG